MSRPIHLAEAEFGHVADRSLEREVRFTVTVVVWCS